MRLFAPGSQRTLANASGSSSMSSARSNRSSNAIALRARVKKEGIKAGVPAALSSGCACRDSEEDGMKLLTVIVNYKTSEMTLTAVTATLRALTRVAGEWKITVVDNDSQDTNFAKLCQAVTAQQQANHPGTAL